MQESKNNIEISLGICKKVPDIAVCFSIPYACPDSVIKRLSALTAAKSEVSKDAELAALASALFSVIRSKLIGTPLDTFRSKVSNIKCKALNGNFIIYWNCQGTGAALRKTLSLVVGSLQPAKLYAKYKEKLKYLGASAPREHFNYCVGKMNTAIKSKISVSVVGRINIDSQKLKVLLAAVYGKMPDLPSPDGESKAPPTRECQHEMYPHVKTSNSLANLLVADYIFSNTDAGVEVHSGVVEIYDKNWETRRSKLKAAARINNYVQQKYGNKSIVSDLALIVAYHGMSHSFADNDAIKKLIVKNLTTKDVAEMIKNNI